MRRFLAATSFMVAFGIAGIAVAQSDLAEQREKDMKTIGGAVKVSADFVQGKADFDPAAAKAAMERIAVTAKDFVTLFPEGSESADSKASPEIWKNKADFEAHAAKLASDATAGAAAAEQGLDAFKVAFGNVTGNCKACHQVYRLSD